MSDPAQNTPRPAPNFCFSVTGLPGNPVFQEAAGLTTPSQETTPGPAKAGVVTLKTGVFPTDPALWTWLDAIKMNKVERGTVVISLLGETAEPECAWTLTNAWPAKITGADLQSGAAAVAVESLELVYDTMTVTTGG